MNRIAAFIEANQALIVVFGAALLKVLLSSRLGWKGALVTYFSAVFLAWVGTPPALHYFGLTIEYWSIVAAVIALTGEQIARALIFLVSDPEMFKDMLQRRMGKK